MKSIFAFVVAALIAVPALAGGRTLGTVYFDTDSAKIDDIQAKMVCDTAEIIDSRSLKVVVIGNADERGKRTYNLDLGARRAGAVAKKLVECGASGEAILDVSYGEERPAAPHGVRDHLATNRRVDIVLVEPETKTVEKVVEKRVVRRHRISAALGAGPHTLDKTDKGTYLEVEWEFKPVGGLQYQYLTPLFDDRLSIGISGYSNATFTINAGFEF